MNYSFDGYVGVIDSGVGGLTVLKKIQKNYPNCSYLYFADSAHCPYGTKSQLEVYNRVDCVLSFLQACGITSVVIACNTASIHADKLRTRYDFPIYDVIMPTCNYVAKITRAKRVALLATNTTIESGAYQRRLSTYGIDTVAFKCSSFVPFVEANTVNSVDCKSAINRAISSLPQSNVDTVVLGCTHFPVLRKQIAPYVNGATVVECRCNFIPADLSCSGQSGQTVYLTTGDANSVNIASKWFGNVNFRHINV